MFPDKVKTNCMFITLKGKREKLMIEITQLKEEVDTKGRIYFM